MSKLDDQIRPESQRDAVPLRPLRGRQIVRRVDRPDQRLEKDCVPSDAGTLIVVVARDVHRLWLGIGHGSAMRLRIAGAILPATSAIPAEA